MVWLYTYHENKKLSQPPWSGIPTGHVRQGVTGSLSKGAGYSLCFGIAYFFGSLIYFATGSWGTDPGEHVVWVYTNPGRKNKYFSLWLSKLFNKEQKWPAGKWLNILIAKNTGKVAVRVPNLAGPGKAGIKAYTVWIKYIANHLPYFICGRGSLLSGQRSSGSTSLVQDYIFSVLNTFVNHWLCFRL